MDHTQFQKHIYSSQIKKLFVVHGFPSATQRLFDFCFFDLLKGINYLDEHIQATIDLVTFAVRLEPYHHDHRPLWLLE